MSALFAAGGSTVMAAVGATASAMLGATSATAGTATAFASGAAAGLAIAVPVGAVATLIVLLGAERGWRVGAAAGLGAATVDGVYATVALVAGAALAPVLDAHRTPLRWSSSVVLLVVAVALARPVWRRASGPAVTADADGAQGPDGAPAGLGPRRAYLTVLGLTAVNPATVVYFAALVAGPAASAVRTGPQRGAFVLGAALASACWQLLLAGAGTAVGGLLTGPRGRRWTSAVGALAVAALAVHTAIGG